MVRVSSVMLFTSVHFNGLESLDLSISTCHLTVMNSIKYSNQVSESVLIKKVERGLDIVFQDSDTIAFSPIWTLGSSGWSFQCIYMKTNGIKLFFEESRLNGGKIYVKVIHGQICIQGNTDSIERRRPIMADKFEKFNAQIPSNSLLYAEKDAVFFLFRQSPNSLSVISKVNDMELIGESSESLHWINCSKYGWGSHFDNLDFHNLRGFVVWINNEYVAYSQLWLAGLGVDCGDHDHSELQGSDAFCEIHMTLVNGSGQGGMVARKGDGGEIRVPLEAGEEHGPFYNVINGKPVYCIHRWESGGKFESSQKYDLWIAFELPVNYI